MSENVEPTTKKLPDGYHVFWEPVRFSPQEIETIEAVLPDGTRLRPVFLLGGRRLGFDRAVPIGTQLLRHGKLIGTVGQS
jgi:hypothetical protein